MPTSKQQAMYRPCFKRSFEFLLAGPRPTHYGLGRTGRDICIVSGSYGTETKQRLLDAAYEAFSESGYDGASVRQIVVRAGTNIASVNYHFGGKDALYREVVSATFSKVTEDLGEIMQQSDPESDPLSIIRDFAQQRLKQGVRRKRFFPPRLLGWEIVSPKLNIKNLFEERFSSLEEKLIVLLSPLFKPDTPDAQKVLIARWFFSNTMPPPPVGMALQSMLGSEPDEEALDQVTGQMADALLKGVQSLASNANSRQAAT